jgi:hypothetical protein
MTIRGKRENFGVVSDIDYSVIPHNTASDDFCNDYTQLS